ncbi:hypothetical protein HUG10_07395 [Halorarum halophilum]|uniref:DUF7344 domain-containing protein n=1 Tax=Halorarum halophilum TaxID=2743090 RepID=A0A7D5KM36_9EURY|nr:hypothetical protein [Halobaculum halophilum]QLG27382.1 hypothetical protein HUG10_07395 [Halobaculum halophilum]
MRDNRHPSEKCSVSTVTSVDDRGREWPHLHTNQGSLIADGGKSVSDRPLEGLVREYDRYILYHLLEHESTEFDELVDVIAAIETGDTAAGSPDAVRTRIAVELYHVRLPKLDDLGLIEYDHDSGIIRYGNPPPYVEKVLHLTQDFDDA